MYSAVRQRDKQEPQVLGHYDSYEQAHSKIAQAVIEHRNVFGRDGSISRVTNSASRYPFRVEITNCGIIDRFYIQMV